MHPFADLLPWLNLLLLPAVHYLGKISTTLATLSAVQGEHARRLESIEAWQHPPHQNQQRIMQ